MSCIKITAEDHHVSHFRQFNFRGNLVFTRFSILGCFRAWCMLWQGLLSTHWTWWPEPHFPLEYLRTASIQSAWRIVFIISIPKHPDVLATSLMIVTIRLSRKRVLSKNERKLHSLARRLKSGWSLKAAYTSDVDLCKIQILANHLRHL